MDPYLKELCMEIVRQNITSPTFDSLVMETGVLLEKDEWEFANRILYKNTDINPQMKNIRDAVN